MKVYEVMTREVVTTTPQASLKEAARTLARRGISGLPVVSGSGTVVGVVSEADVIAKEAPPERVGRAGPFRRLRGAPDRRRGARFAARTVEEGMTSPARTIHQGRPVAEAAERMLESGVNRLPVVGDDGELVGIVTRHDLVRAFARPDEAIQREIEDVLLRRTLWLDHPDEIHVEVDGGEVILSGRAGSAADRELVPRYVRRVPGVVGVSSTLALRESRSTR